MDANAPLSVGESLGDNPASIDHAGVKSLFETALRAETKSELAYYDQSSVVGKLRPGPIRSGDIYTLESWQERVAVAEIRGSNLSAELVSQLQETGAPHDPTKTYRVATTDYIASELSEKIGRIDSRRPGPMLRDLTVSYLRSHPFGKTT
jgi:hypothetical protein